MMRRLVPGDLGWSAWESYCIARVVRLWVLASSSDALCIHSIYDRLFRLWLADFVRLVVFEAFSME